MIWYSASYSNTQIANDMRARVKCAIDLKIKKLHGVAAQWVRKNDGQNALKCNRCRTLSEGGARVRYYHEVVEA